MIIIIIIIIIIQDMAVKETAKEYFFPNSENFMDEDATNNPNKRDSASKRHYSTSSGGYNKIICSGDEMINIMMR